MDSLSRNITSMLSRSSDPEGARLVEMIGQLEAANRLMGAGHYMAATECLQRVQSWARSLVPQRDVNEVERRVNIMADGMVGQAMNPSPFDRVRRRFGQ